MSQNEPPLPEWDVTCRFDDEQKQEHRLTRRFRAELNDTACVYMVNYLMAGLCIVHEIQIKEVKAWPLAGAQTRGMA